MQRGRRACLVHGEADEDHDGGEGEEPQDEFHRHCCRRGWRLAPRGTASRWRSEWKGPKPAWWWLCKARGHNGALGAGDEIEGGLGWGEGRGAGGSRLLELPPSLRKSLNHVTDTWISFNIQLTFTCVVESLPFESRWCKGHFPCCWLFFSEQ